MEIDLRKKCNSSSTETAAKLKLYSYFRSSCAWRVRIALEYKGLPYDVIPIQLMRKEQFQSDFVKLNPMAQVPALIVEEKVTLLQSLAIIEYLDDVYPNVPLLPKDPLLRAKVREISELIASGIQPLQNLRTLHKHSDDPNEKLRWAQFWIHNGLQALEKTLTECSGVYCVGNDITMADCCLVPQVANAYRFKVDTSGFPVIARIEKMLSEEPAFQRAHASNQPDCPPELYSKL
ncbi:putative maleylacetoacetate isomerase 2 [Orchesella cincta]|uniref:maleylacetoacetate isomerase n=1 Tax=Orchesella cincta TaxID=48709 RepID=A0A1D2MGX8_ORCCI|nr:putative maleylacetoacetate isomerase 2 [Orchesella cincta]